ncbi:MAG: hypothetical protein JO065_02805 [Acidobacteria bacterium]|nr:hypothetical protein [Acidobacteriota bacterium]MBV9436038.1 hypothetical protein [Acidobacteriota bacterium]
MNLHKLYLGSFAALCIFGIVVGAAWRDHVRDDARRDAILDTEKSSITELKQSMAAARAQSEAQLAQWEQRRRQLAVAPQQAPEVIRELVPMQTPIAQSAPPSAQSAPDSPGAVLTKQQEVDLAQYAVSCKECALQRDQLQQQVNDQQSIIGRQEQEIAATRRAAKGGSVWQRAVRIAKWGAIFGGVGYVVGRAQR